MGPSPQMRPPLLPLPPEEDCSVVEEPASLVDPSRRTRRLEPLPPLLEEVSLEPSLLSALWSRRDICV